MLFADGVASGLGGALATHPPLEQRIERVLPGFLIQSLGLDAEHWLRVYFVDGLMDAGGNIFIRSLQLMVVPLVLVPGAVVVPPPVVPVVPDVEVGSEVEVGSVEAVDGPLGAVVSARSSSPC